MKEPKVLTRMRLFEWCGDTLGIEELKEVNNYIKNLQHKNQKLKSILELYKVSLHREHEAIHRANDLEDENQKLKEKIDKIQSIANYEYDFYDSAEELMEDIRKILGILSEVE